MTFTIGFTAGAIFGIGLMIGLWKWVETRLDADDHRVNGETE
jgi:hypothetical protein